LSLQRKEAIEQLSMNDLRVGKLLGCVTGHLGRLNLLPSVGW